MYTCANSTSSQPLLTGPGGWGAASPCSRPLARPLQVVWHAFGADHARGELTRGVWFTKPAPSRYDPRRDAVAYAGGAVALRP